MKKKILIADDEMAWLYSNNEIIDLGFPEMFEIKLAESAKEALNIADEFIPDMLITDLEMEKIRKNLCAGEYLIQEIKKKFDNIKIIIISGAPNIEIIATRNNVDAFIPKWALNNYPINLKLKISEIFKIKTEIC